MNFRKAIAYSLLILSILLGMIGILAYFAAFKSNIKTEKPNYTLLVYPNETDVNLSLKFDSILCNTSSFVQLAGIIKLSRLKPGRYVFKAGMNNFSIVNKLKRGMQDPVKLTINNVRDVYQLSAKLGEVLLPDSIDFIIFLNDSSILNKYNYTSDNILSLFIPNTYEMYWTITPEKFLQRMIFEHESFWNKENRKEKANKMGLNYKEVYALASIVDKETILENEKQIISGVYLNRLKSGMKLQADPTVVYALGIKGIQRVLYEHLRIESPYNTYLVEGLPPGPIWMPSVSTIDSVLNSQNHEYIFFCAKPGFDGSHAFAKTLEGHYQNAKIYRDWLNKVKIR